MIALKVHRLCFFCFTSILLNLSVFAQSPGGVSSGTVRGWKVEHFDGTFGTNFNGFGTGSSNTTPGVWGYTGYVTGEEFSGYDATNFGLQYSGTLEVPQTGTYTINVYNIDDNATLYINGVQRAIYTWSGSRGSVTATVSLTAGDHNILLKFIQAGGPGGVNIRWSGPGITANSDLDGRFVRVDNAQLAAWYKASNVNITANYSGVRSRVNNYINQAPAFTNTGNLSNTGTGWAPLNEAYVNFNPTVHFSGDDRFSSTATQSGLAFRNAPRTFVMVNSFNNNLAGSGWLMGQSGGGTGANMVGFWKNNGMQTAMARDGAATPLLTSAYHLNEPKLLTGDILLGTGNAASANNSRSVSANGGTASILGFTERITNYNNNGRAFEVGATGSSFTSGSFIPEVIYYPFELTAAQKQRVNTYLAIKYGVTLQHNYVNTSGGILWNTTTNAAYNNRIVGIGRELTVQGLNQKQSQSQMAGSPGYNFLVLSKGAIATTNDANTGSLSDGDYMITGDDNGALTAQTTEIPASFGSGCVALRIGREWKVQIAGNPGPVTLRAGAAGAYLFPASAAGIAVLIDTDGDGNFNTGTVTTLQASSYAGGVATFNNVTIPNGAVITFAWTSTSPGGVFSSLALWLKADGELYSDLLGNTPVTDGNTVALWRDGSTLANNVSQATAGSRPTYRNNAASLVNFNPVLQFTMGSSYLQTSSVSSALNNNITGFSAHKFGGSTSNWNAVMGSRRGSPSTGWNIYISNATGQYSLWTAIGDGWTQTTATNAAGTLPDLISFSALLGGGAKNLYEKGRLAANLNGAYITNTTNQFQVGSNGDNNLNFGGNIYEQIVYSSVLSDADRRKVESYLAIKYGTALDQTTTQNYLSSDGTIVWNGAANATYRNSIFGIGRDDCSGLMQKQSKSTTAGDNIILSIGNIAISNADNTGSFPANKQYLLVGHDGAALSSTGTDVPAAFMASSCNARRYAREWKVSNINGVDNVTLTIGDAVNKVKTSMTNLHLAVDTDGDGNFATGTVTLYPSVSLSNGVATFNNISLPHGSVFTVCWGEAAPGGVFSPSGGTSPLGPNYLNGLTYQFYTGTTTEYPSVLSLGGLSAMPGTLVSSGYLSELTNVHNLFTQYATVNMGIEIKGKIYIPATTNTYQFRGEALDDNLSVRIGGTLVFEGSYTSGSNVTGVDQTLTQGYHDIVIRFSQGGGGVIWRLSWNGGSGTDFSAIPSTNLFTTFAGPSAWYAADDIQLQNNTDGTNLGALAGTKWADMSANANDMITASGNPRYYNSNTSYLRNYNPSVYYTANNLQSADNINGFALGGLGKSAFSVAENSANTAFTVYSSFGRATAGNSFGLGKRANNQLTVFTYAADLNETSAFYTNSTASTDIIGTTLNAARAANIYANGAQRASNGVLYGSTAFNTFMQRLYVGGNIESATLNYTGRMNEIIHYPWALSANEQQRINSYLAIKWGVTLNQSTPTNYLSGDGTITWTGNATFKHDITGIGRDDCSALNQLQSTSTDSLDIVTISKGNLAATNYANASSFSNNKQFVIFGHNNGTINTLNATNMPTALLSISDCYQKLGRVWRVQETGGAGAVQVQLGKSGLFLFNKSYYKPKLLVSSSSTDWSSATVIDADSVSNGIVHFGNITFSGVQYFTIAIIQAAPGGVATNLNLWLSADDGTSTTTNNTGVTSWSDLSLQNMHATGVSNPIYRSGSSEGAANFNPSVSFNGSSQHFTLPTGFSNFTLGTTAFSVLNTNFGTLDSWGRLFHLGTASNLNALAFNRNDATNNISSFTSNASSGSGHLSTTSSPLATTNGFNIYAFRLQAGTDGLANKTGNVYVNGLTSAASSTLSTPTTISRTHNYVGNGTNSEFINGYMPEIILYNRDLTYLESKKINSYLAIKYGRTLPDTVTSYINSASSVVFNYATHWNRVTIIGRDDCQALEQKQSKSAETGAMVTIGIGNSLATENTTNINMFTNDKSYAAFGDNNKAATWTGVDNFGNGLVRLNRIWRMKETGTIGTVYIEVPGHNSVLTAKLPVGDKPSDPVYLVISNSGNFKAGVTWVEMIPDVVGPTTRWYTTYDFADGDYFTFGTKKLCVGPAGITDGLTTWYRADNKSEGAIAPTSGKLIDETGAHTLTRNANGTANVIAGSATSFNYNRIIRFANDADLTKGSLTVNDVLASNAGSLFGVSTSTSNGLFGIGIGSNNSVVTGVGSGARFNGVNSAYTTGTTVPGKPNIMVMRAQTGVGVQSYLNGTAGSVTPLSSARPTGSWTIQLNTVYYDSWNNADFGEAFSFNRRITDAEAVVLNSYLALKYGQTLSHNYYTADYDGTNASSATIYDISSYNNRIFGVGVDSTGCLYQKQSTSQLTGSMLKMSISNAIAADNISNTGVFTLDRTYVAAGDDDGAINAWVVGTTPAIYNTGMGNCNQPLRVVRQWKLKATNNQQTILITVPSSSNIVATTKLPVLPVGSTKLYMVANQSGDFSINASQEELEMTFNATSNEWEVLYTLPNGVYKYITFVTKPDLAGLQPIVVGTGIQDATSADCNATPYIYYRGTTNSSNAIIAINPNNNTWAPTSLTIDNTGTHTGGTGTFSNSGIGYYQSTDGLNTYRITKRLHTIVASGTYDLNDGVLVRLYYADADTMAMLTDPLPGGGTIQRKGWFKYAGNAAATVASMRPPDPNVGEELIPVAWGTEQGVRYAEFLVNSFSTFGYFAKTTSMALPVVLDYFKGRVDNCENILSWKSEIEQNFAYYELQYSVDGAAFTATGMEVSKGDASAYEMKHTPPGSTTYYRLKMVDKDGTFKYSAIIKLVNNCEISSLRLYPNPVQNELFVSGVRPGTLIRISDIKGRGVITIKANTVQEKIHLGNLTKGIYIVEFFNNLNDDKRVFKILKE